MDTFDPITFIMGIVLGMIIMLFLVWFAYYTRTFIFTYCPTQARGCVASDYFINPGNALANGSKLEDILFIDKQGDMLYKRVPKNGDCVPQRNQVVQIRHPQYCSFRDSQERTYKQLAFGSNIYKPADDLPGETVVTDVNCYSETEGYTDGIPLLEWDPSPTV